MPESRESPESRETRESRPYHHGDLRSALLAGAERTLREKGVGALSLRELAREVGVSHAAPGRHFKDKQALLNALALEGYERLRRTIADADTPGLPLQDRLTSLARAYLGFAAENAELLELMFARKHDPAASELLFVAVDQTVGALERIIVEAQRCGEIVEGDPAYLTLALGATLQGTATFAANGHIDPQEALAGVGGLVHLLLHGLSPR
ncbi:TetR/AcrR family transcriptional regulator [Streptomyces sp. NPDC047072]|uniref:TetR/AcrR family transcriptional regulator n=1 Tax=Streptomyces sp. NPDC047072 TaxID=3154809 RepID=UPI003406E54A